MMEHWNIFWGAHSEMILEVGYKGALVIVTLLASHFTAKILHRSINKASDRFERLDQTLVPILCTGTSVAVYAIGLVIILDFFGVNTASIIALLGAAGLAIALALKDTLSNIAAGMMLLFLRPFRSGHFIECGSIQGTVKEIGLFTTILQTPDGLYISAPNSSLWGAPIKNFTTNGKRRMDLVVGIAYTDSIDKGFEALQTVIQKEPRFMTDPSPQVMVQAMADSSVNLQLRAWASVEDYWDVYWKANKMVKEQIDAAGLTIPFPQRDVHLIQEQ